MAEKNVTNNVTDCNINHVVEVMQRFPRGISRKKVAELLGVKVTTLSRTWSRACHTGLIKQIGYGTFVLSNEKQKSVTDFSVGLRKCKIDLHALQLSFPIIDDQSKPEAWDKLIPMNNWTKGQKRIDGITIQKNTKVVQAWLWSQKIKSPQEIEQLAHSMVFKVATALWKIGVTVDIDHVQTVTKHVAIQKSELEEIYPKGTSVTVDLGRFAKKIFEDDKNEPAKAWTDDSPFRSIETNDVEYAKAVLQMPLHVERMSTAIASFADQSAEYAEEIREHRAAIKEIRETMAEMRDFFKNKGETS